MTLEGISMKKETRITGGLIQRLRNLLTGGIDVRMSTIKEIR